MKKTKHHNHNPVDEAFSLQRSIYNSRNPTRKWLHNSRLHWLTAAIGRYFPMPSKGPALDVGTGCGILIPSLSRQFDTVISLDIETEFLSQIKNRPIAGANIHYITGDVRALPVRDDTAELIVCAEVLEHIDNDLACLKEIIRVLKPGGILMLSTPQPRSLLEFTASIVLRRSMMQLVRRIYREPVQPTGHINLMSARRLAGKLTRIGFTIIETHKSGLYLPGLAEIPAQAPQKIAAALNARISGTRLDFLLWTQFFVARKPPPPRPGTRPAEHRRQKG